MSDESELPAYRRFLNVAVPVALAITFVLLFAVFVMPHLSGPTETVGWLA